MGYMQMEAKQLAIKHTALFIILFQAVAGRFFQQYVA